MQKGMQTMIDNPTEHREPGVPVWIDVMRAIWWLSALWLLLALAVMVYLFLKWVFLRDDPTRYETGVLSAFVFFCSVPAGLGVLVAGLLPRTGLTPFKRLGGIALLLVCVGVLMLHDYLQARYR